MCMPNAYEYDDDTHYVRVVNNTKGNKLRLIAVFYVTGPNVFQKTNGRIPISQNKIGLFKGNKWRRNVNVNSILEIEIKLWFDALQYFVYSMLDADP